jgi:hypothetical protein
MTIQPGGPIGGRIVVNLDKILALLKAALPLGAQAPGARRKRAPLSRLGFVKWNSWFSMSSLGRLRLPFIHRSFVSKGIAQPGAAAVVAARKMGGRLSIPVSIEREVPVDFAK